MTARTLYFTAPETVAVRTRSVPDPAPEEVRVQTVRSAISAGTEGLLYRGEAPSELPADETIDALGTDLSYPLAYGYAAVGEVTAVGSAVPDRWLGRRVFGYNPHESHFLARPEALVPVPDDISTREATLLANAETAVNFMLDGEPVLGERVAVLGQGVVGLLTTALLAETPIETLLAIETIESRRTVAESFGADRTLDPDRGDVPTAGRERVGAPMDLVYELSGDPSALEDAIGLAGFDARVIVGSWYGTKPATLDLGGRFHRDRIDVRSSQVSTIAPRHEGRWSRERRHEVAWNWLERLDLEELFTHEFPLEDADAAYRLLSERPEEALGVTFTYD